MARKKASKAPSFEVRKAQALQKVRSCGLAILALDEEVREDREVVLEAVRRSGIALEYASRRLRDDREVVLEAVRHFPKSLQFASKRLCADRDVVLEAVTGASGCWEALSYASEELRATKAVVLAAVDRKGRALRYASQFLQADYDVVLRAAMNSLCALRYASAGLLADRSTVLGLISVSGLALQYVSEHLSQDRDIVVQAVQSTGRALEFAAEIHRADREVVFEAIRRNGHAWIHAAEELQSDEDMLLLAARSLRREDNSDYDFKRFEAVVAQRISEKVVTSFIAVPGEEVPIVSINMSHTPTSIGSDNKTQDQIFSPGFCCEVYLFSGANFSCVIADDGATDAKGESRSSPTLNDLAKMIVEELPKHTQVVNADRVFINFRLNDDGDAVATSPWDCDRPLSDFLTFSHSGS